MRCRYRAKAPTKFVLDLAPQVQLELSVNSSHPKGDIQLLRLESVPKPLAAALPSPASLHRIVPLAKVAAAAPGEWVDVAGVVVRLGRCMLAPHARGFWEYRWVQIMDGACHTTLKLFTCSQPDLVRALCLGDMLVATRLRPTRFMTDSHSEIDGALHFRTSTTSQFACWPAWAESAGESAQQDWWRKHPAVTYFRALPEVSAVQARANMPINRALFQKSMFANKQEKNTSI